MLNLNSQTLDELAARIGQALQNSPAKDLERNVKALLTSSLSRLDLVTRQEFDIQREVLQRTREKVEALETRVADLEARVAGVKPPSAA
jgi:BMFP domain-containing protein YqiC